MNQKLNKTMKVVATDRFGGIETLKTRQLSIPDVGANEVLVRVEAAGVGVWDPFEREGGFAKEYNVQPTFPLVLGSDGAGTVEAVGDGVQTLKKRRPRVWNCFDESKRGILCTIYRAEGNQLVAHSGPGQIDDTAGGSNAGRCHYGTHGPGCDAWTEGQ